MDMFRVKKIWKECKDETQCHPECYLGGDGKDFTAPPAPEIGEHGGEWLPLMMFAISDFEGLTQKTSTYMK
jgi:hypothetical protein